MAPDHQVLVFRDAIGAPRWSATIVIGVLLAPFLAWIGCDASTLGPDRSVRSAAAWGAVAALGWAVSRAVRPVDVAVGADGIAVCGRRFPRFVPFGTLDGVTWRADGGELEIRESGAATKRYGWTSLAGGGADEFLLAVAWARERYAERRAGFGLVPLLARGDRTVTAWRASLRQLADSGAAYRAPTLDGGELWRVLDDPSATEETRVGAALVLVAMRPAEAPARVRSAAEACAHAPMRAALERAVDGELDEAALAKLRRT